MDIKEYSKLIKAKRKELDDLMKRKMPVIAGRMAKDHFQDNFRREGFVNGGLNHGNHRTQCRKDMTHPL